MMEDRVRGQGEGTGWIEAIRVLLFNVLGVRMGVDVEQTAGMLDPRNASVEQLNVVSFHEKLFRRDDRPTYVAPMVLLVKDDEGNHGLLIDQPENIVSVGAEDIRPLPALIEASMQSRAVWGVALIEGEMVLLVDLYELVASGMPES
jgi:chemotaxis signal transduction protein